MSNFKSKIWDELVYLSMLLNQKQDDIRLKSYVEVLSDCGVAPEQIILGIKSLRLSAKFFPSIPEIIDASKPNTISNRDQANIIANEIITAVAKYGWYQTQQAKETLGDFAWNIASQFGWNALCNSMESELNTIRAQLRDLANANIELSKNGISREQILKVESKPNQSTGLISVKNFLD